MRTYRGDCHVHSAHTVDGGLTPDELVAAARALGLDFIATAGHNTATEHTEWAPYLGGVDPLVILGQEVVTSTGHWLALGLAPGQAVDWRYGVRDGVVGTHVAQVREAGGLCVAAHPHAPYPSGVFMYPYDGFDLVEVWNGPWSSDEPWQADNEAAVAEWGRSLGASVHDGLWRPAIGNSDTHFAGQLGVPQTVVRAEELSTRAILGALRAGRSWILDSRDVELSVTARAGDRTARIADLLPTGGKPVEVAVAVRGVPGGVVTFHTERGTVHRAPVADGPVEVGWTTSAAESAFVRVQVRHAGGAMAALTNPIILA